MILSTVEDALVALLDNQPGYRVEGYESVVVAAPELVGNNRLIQAFYSDGTFPEGEGSASGERVHKASFTLRLMAAAATQVDKAIFEDETSTETERETAISNLEKAAKLAHASLIEFWGLVFDRLTDNRNYNLGIDESTLIISDFWIPRFEKARPISDGEYIVVGGESEYSCKFIEQATGEEPQPLTVIDSELTFNGDPAKTGVTNDF